MKKTLFFIAAFFITLSITHGIIAKAESSPPQVEAEGAVLMDATTGQIIYSKNDTKILAPASTTKVMTALLTLEKANLNDKVTIGKKPPTAEGTSIGLKEGEVYTVNDLLHGLLLESANDCAEALAEYVGGSVENFAKMMNDKAKELGAKDTHFVNPSGLYENNHKTTAYDLSLIMREAVKNPKFIKIAREVVYKFPPSNIDGKEKWVSNKNDLIKENNTHYYKYALVGKTGYTTPSKHTYTCAAEKNGHILIASLLYSQSKQYYFDDTKKLFEYGFNNFQLVKLFSEGEQVATYKVDDSLTVPLLSSKDVYYLAKESELKQQISRGKYEKLINPQLSIENKNLKEASFKKGEKILSSKVLINNNEIVNLELTSGIDRNYNKPLLLRNIIIILVSIVLGTLLAIRKYNLYRRKRFLKRKYKL